VKNIGIETCNLTYQTEDQTELMGRMGLTMTRQNEVLHKARTALNPDFRTIYSQKLI